MADIILNSSATQYVQKKKDQSGQDRYIIDHSLYNSNDNITITDVEYINGDITARKLTIGSSCVINGSIEADEVLFITEGTPNDGSVATSNIEIEIDGGLTSNESMILNKGLCKVFGSVNVNGTADIKGDIYAIQGFIAKKPIVISGTLYYNKAFVSTSTVDVGSVVHEGGILQKNNITEKGWK